MGDKKLDDLMKDLQTYTVQVAQEKKKLELEAMKEPVVIPWKYIFLGLIALTWYFRTPVLNFGIRIAQEPEVMKVLNALDMNNVLRKPGPSALELRKNILEGKEQANKPLPTLENGRVPAEAVTPHKDFVQIEGKWYKKTDDNIYLINGRRVFFVDNRFRQAKPASK